MTSDRPPNRRTAEPPTGGGRALRVLAITMALVAVGSRGWAQDTTGVATQDLPPAGFGTLHQEDIALRIQTGPLQIRIVPLDERITRLLSPDTYASLHRLHESKADQVQQLAERYGIRSPTLFLVTFFGLQERARFNPEILTITSQNRFFRPVEILPLSPLWSGQQLNQRETATAIYMFEDGIQVLDPFTVSYEGGSSQGWEQTIRTLDRERASVQARAAAARKKP